LLPLTGAPGSPCVQDVADAVLYLGRTDRLTRMQPWALVFRDEEYWRELDLRRKLIYGRSFDLAKTGFDLRSPLVWPPPQNQFPPVPGSTVQDAVTFVYERP
jgi:hypothetical protein